MVMSYILCEYSFGKSLLSTKGIKRSLFGRGKKGKKRIAKGMRDNR
jgi:hypothetical protein